MKLWSCIALPVIVIKSIEYHDLNKTLSAKLGEVTYRYLIRGNCLEYGMDPGKLNRGPRSAAGDRENSKYI